MKKYCSVMLFCLPIVGCRQSITAPPAEQPVIVRTVRIAETHAGGKIQVAGVVAPHLEADLASQIVAQVAAVTKREGDFFRKGEVLVRLHAPALDANVAQANAALNSAVQEAAAASDQEKLAADTSARYTQLRARHSVTPNELDQITARAATAHAQQQAAEAQVTAARSALAAVRATASDALIYAPFDGVVTRRMVDPGAVATPGVALLHVQSVGTPEVAFAAPDSLASSLRVDGEVSVALPGSSPLSANVERISPAGNAGTHTLTVRASLPGSAMWNTGTVVEVFLSSDRESSRVLVPSSAIVQQGGLDAVLVASADGHAQVRYVTLGATLPGETEVLSGLRVGDEVLVRGDLGLAGRTIEVQP